MKKCSQCGRIKPLQKYYCFKSKPIASCKDCYNGRRQEYRKRYYEQNLKATSFKAFKTGREPEPPQAFSAVVLKRNGSLIHARCRTELGIYGGHWYCQSCFETVFGVNLMLIAEEEIN